MSNISDFIIENGVLTRYTGPGGDVVIPQGVTSISSNAFEPPVGPITSVRFPASMHSIDMEPFLPHARSLDDIFLDHPDAGVFFHRDWWPFGYITHLPKNGCVSIGCGHNEFNLIFCVAAPES